MLCIMNGAMAGLSGGALGYVFGFGKLNTTDDVENGKAPAMVENLYLVITVIKRALALQVAS